MDRFALSAVGGVVERGEDVARGTGPAATPSPPDSRACAWGFAGADEPCRLTIPVVWGIPRWLLS